MSSSRSDVVTQFVCPLFLTGEACSTCTAVCAGGGVCVCHYKKCNWSLTGRETYKDIVNGVDQLDEVNIYETQ